MLFVSDRLELPDSAAVVKLRPWLGGPTAEAWESPGTFDLENAPKVYFAASQREWRKVVRRMVRCGVGAELACKHSATSLFRWSLRSKEG